MKKPAYDTDPGINFEAPVLYDDETSRSRDAKKPGAGKGIIEVDGRRCYVIEWPETLAGADRRVEGPGIG